MWRSCTNSALALLLLAATASPVLARPLLHVEEALRTAVERNPTLLANLASVDGARARLQAAHGLDDLSLTIIGSGASTRRDVVPNLPLQTPAEDRLIASAALEQPLPTGGRLSIDLAEAYSSVRSVVDVGDGQHQLSTVSLFEPSLKLSVAHPLLRGVGVRVARADRHRAEVSLDAALLERERVVATLLRDVLVAYWNLDYAAAELDIRHRGVLDGKEQLEIVRANIENGKAASSAAAEVEVAIELRRDEERQARQRVTACTVELRRLLGLDPGDAGDEAWALDEPPIDAPLPERQRALELVRAHNPELARVRNQERAAAIEADVARNRLLPQLDVNASAGVIGYASDGGRANGQMFDFKSYTLQASLVFHEPLARRAERGAHEAALAELRKDRLEAHASQAQLETAAVNTLALVESARDRAQGLARGVGFAESDLAAERARFLSGRSSTFDVLRKQQVLLDARLRLLRARIDFAQAHAELDALTGDIFCHGGVSRRACEP